jgi:hypothetical protein
MAEGRMLKKKISLNETLADLANDSHRLLFTWGIAHLGEEGRITGSFRGFKALVAPLLDHITPETVLSFFHDAESLGLIQRYEVDGDLIVGCTLIISKFFSCKSFFVANSNLDLTNR